MVVDVVFDVRIEAVVVVESVVVKVVGVVVDVVTSVEVDVIVDVITSVEVNVVVDAVTSLVVDVEVDVEVDEEVDVVDISEVVDVELDVVGHSFKNPVIPRAGEYSTPVSFFSKQELFLSQKKLLHMLYENNTLFN